MSIIDRYIAVSLIKTILLTLFGLMVLFAFFSLLNELEKIGRGHYGVGHAFSYVFLTTPGLVIDLLPVAAVIGSAAMLGILANNSELAILFTSGFSQLRLACSMGKGALFFTLSAFLLNEIIVPHAEQTAHNLREVAFSGTDAVSHQLWFKDRQSFINMHTSKGNVESIYIYEFDNAGNLRTSGFTEHVNYDGKQWLFEDIQQTVITDVGVKAQPIKLAKYSSSLNAEALSRTIDSRYLSLPALYAQISYLKSNNQNSVSYERIFWARIINPLTVIVMVLMAIPMVKSDPRKAILGQRIAIGCLFGVLFHVLNQASGLLGIVYHLNPVLGTAFLPLAVLAITTWLLLKST